MNVTHARALPGMRIILASIMMALVLVAGGSATASDRAHALSTCTNDTWLQSTTYRGAIVPSIGNNTHRFDCVMGQGAQSDGVWALQRSLRNCHGRRIAVDGIFGPKTRTALVQVQAALGISADGVYGPQTRRAMRWYAPIGKKCNDIF